MSELETRRRLTEHVEALILARTLTRRGAAEGADISVVDGVVMMSPVTLEHSDTHYELVVQLRPQARALGLRLAGHVPFMHPAWPDALCPDVAVWEPPAGPTTKPLDATAILLAIERPYLRCPGALGQLSSPGAGGRGAAGLTSDQLLLRSPTPLHGRAR